MRASAPIYDADYGTDINISMISAQDAARLIVRAIDLRRWPRELCMVGDRMTVFDVCRTVEKVRGSSRCLSESDVQKADIEFFRRRIGLFELAYS